MRAPISLALAAGVALVGASAQPSARQAAAPRAKYTDTIPNTKVTYDMVPDPAGTFMMGSPATEPGRVLAILALTTRTV